MGAADGGVVSVFCVGVGGVEGETDLARGRAFGGLVEVCHVHGVVLEGGVIVVLEAGRSELASDDVDVGLG